MRIVRTLALSAAAATALVTATAAGPATADSPNWHRTLDVAIAPFQLAVNHQWVYVADGFTGTVTRYKGSAKEVVASVPGEIAAVDLTADGKTMAFTTATADGTALVIRTAGRPDVVADLSTYEATQNPDAGVTYGFVAGTPVQCTSAFESLLQFPATYPGVVDSHPYAVASLGDGSWAVADAGGNDILRVSANGHVSTLAVLPTQRLTLTAGQAEAFGVPECAGQTYLFEPVPTDVEASGGSLWVSTLPGGDEAGVLGNRGKVYRVNAGSGASTEVASGFGGATNLAVAPEGTLYVSEFFGGKVTEVRNGTHRTVAELTTPIGLEVQGAYVYVGTFAQLDFETGELMAPGSVLRIKR